MKGGFSLKLSYDESYLLILTKRLIGYLIKRGATQSDAQDIAQDTLIKILEIEDVIAPEELQPWIFRIGFNQYLDLYRTTKRREQIVESFAHTLLPRSTVENYEDLYQAWENLTFEQRLLLLMKYDEKLSLAEIAFRLNRPAASLKTELYRARKALKIEIEKSEENG